MNEIVATEAVEVDALLQAVREQFHYDFRHYSRATLLRRLRLVALRLGCTSLSELQRRLSTEPAAFRALLDGLTIRVTEMFRDAGYFLTFRQRVVPMLRAYPSRRIWIAGCSTGEEAYSFAVVLAEEGLLERTRLYATDINPEALRVAVTGVYPVAKMAEFTRNHQRTGARRSLSDFYHAEYEHAVFSAELRRHIAFADHSLASDGPFADTQVVSCRNVLIYFDAELRNRVLEMFRTTVCTGGYLGLGNRESLRFSSVGRGFSALAESWYTKIAADL